jgi:NTE family protein
MSLRTVYRVAALLSVVARVHAQPPVPASDSAVRPSPRIGVVLSGGGAKGLAHIGVLRVIEAHGIMPTVVTGTSMGALVGGLYAIGYSTAELDSIVTSLEWASYFRNVPERPRLTLDNRFSSERTIITLPLDQWKITLPSGALSGERIWQLLARLTWSVQTERDFRRLPRAFAATATDIETGETIVLDHGSLAEALRASMSIPGLFTPVTVGGRLLVDGGITRNLPARDARALGADVLICSDVSDPLYPASRLHSLVAVLRQTVTIYENASKATERALCDIHIRPNTEGLTPTDFDRAPAWIARGRDAAAAVARPLSELAARLPGPPRTASGRPRSDSVRIAQVLVEGVSGAAERSVRRQLRLPDAGYVTPERLDEAVQRSYATELVDHVHYRLEARSGIPGDTVVVVTVSPRGRDRVGIGLRYDEHNTSLLITARLRNRAGLGSATDLNVRLGEELRAALQHVNVWGTQPLFGGAGLALVRAPLRSYDGDRKIDPGQVDVVSTLAIAGMLLGERGAVGVELKEERARIATTIAGIDTTARRTFATGAAVLRWDSFDHQAFPTRGSMLSLRSEYAMGGKRFSQHVAQGAVAVPLAHHLTALGRAAVGTSSGASRLPLHYGFMLGGSYPALIFPERQIGAVGLRPQQRVGPSVSRAGVGIQWEMSDNVFAILRTDVGYAGRALTLDPDRYETGVGVALGTLTALGPFELCVSKRTNGGRARAELSLGYVF